MAEREGCEVGFCANPADPYTVTANIAGRAMVITNGHVGWTAVAGGPIRHHVAYCPMHALDLLGFGPATPDADS